MRAKSSLLVKLGSNIRSLRDAKGLSQEQLALVSNLDRTYIGGVERGERNISILNLCKIASSLNVVVNVLLEGVC